jgi:hypothetical protein
LRLEGRRVRADTEQPPPTQAMERVPAPSSARAVLGREERRAWGTAGWLALGAPVAAAAAYGTSWPVLWGVTLIAVLAASIFALTGIRTRRVRSGLAAGCLIAFVVGWTRIPDGCHFAVFPLGVDPSSSDPQFVVRLATIRPTPMTEALVAGGTKAKGPVAIFTPDGEVVAVGSVCRKSRGRRVWARRHRATPWWSIDPGRNSPPGV